MEARVRHRGLPMLTMLLLLVLTVSVSAWPADSYEEEDSSSEREPLERSYEEELTAREYIDDPKQEGRLVMVLEDEGYKQLRKTLKLKPQDTHQRPNIFEKDAFQNVAGNINADLTKVTLDEGIREINDAENAHLSAFGAGTDRDQAVRLATIADAGIKELANRTGTQLTLLQGQAALDNQRERFRADRSRAHQGAWGSIRLSAQAARSAFLDALKKNQEVRHEAIADIARSNSDVRDAFSTESAKRYKTLTNNRVKNRNRIQAARADMITARWKANTAILRQLRDEAADIRVFRMNRLAKAREAYAAIMAGKFPKWEDEEIEEEEYKN